MSQAEIGRALTLGKLFLESGFCHLADQEYRSIVRQDPNHQQALLGLAQASQVKGELRDATLAYHRLFRLNAGQAPVAQKLGELFRAQQLISESIKHYLLAARAYHDLGERGRAIDLYLLVLEMDPAQPAACEALLQMGLRFAAPTPPGSQSVRSANPARP